MKITSLRIKILKNTGTKLKGVAAITLDGMIAIHEIKVLENEGGFFLAMPSKTTKHGFKDCVHPINAEVRAAVERNVFGAYNACIENGYEKAQFDVVDKFNGSLLEQSFADFAILGNDDGLDSLFVQKEEEKPKKKGSFFGLFGN